MNICPHCKSHMKLQLIKMHLERGLTVSNVAELAKVYQSTVYRWLERYKKYGELGLVDLSRAPRTHPNEYSGEIKERIKLLRKEGKGIGPDIIKLRFRKRFSFEISRSGIAKFLNKEGLVNEKLSRRIKNKKERIKKCRIHEPGELAQIDIKYAVKSFANHWFYQYSAIDYLTGLAYGNIYELESNFESILFLKSVVKFYPFEIKGIQTDNASVFTNRYTGYLKSPDPLNPRLHPLDLLCKELSIHHYLIDPGKPAQNGKVERFHRTCEQEFYQRESFKDLNSLRKKFRDFLHYYNNEREHLGLNGLTPLEKLQTFPNYEKIKEIV